ncbi:MAG TPA: DedA family protein [Xanthobacteraceae bacterium]|nr:DedA family protein [Xanthobacteraceae bacterium]
MPGSKIALVEVGQHSRGSVGAALNRRSNGERDREAGLFFSIALSHLLSVYGYWAIAGIVGLEGIGIPIPGETTLILAAVYAGSTHHLDIRLVIAAAAAGSIVGSIIGFWIGREIGYPILLRYGHYVRLTESKIKIGQYLFRRHGGKIVFFGRFVPLLRMLAALFAGANRMPWSRFLLFNTAGSVLWTCVYGLGAYYLGQEASRLAAPFEIGLAVVVLVVIFGGAVLLRRHEAQLTAAAERALPGPLQDLRQGRSVDR